MIMRMNRVTARIFTASFIAYLKKIDIKIATIRAAIAISGR